MTGGVEGSADRESRVRPASVEDARAIARIHVESWQAAYRGLIPDRVLDGLDVATRTRQWRQWLAEERVEVLVGETADGEVVGFCTLVASRDRDDDPAAVLSIPTLYIAPDRWRRGWGRALLRRVIEGARRRGCSELTLWVLEGNVRARRFYERLGLVADGACREDASLTGTPLAEVRYRIALSGGDSSSSR